MTVPPFAVLTFIVMVAVFAAIDLAAYFGVIPGGTFSGWVRRNRRWTSWVYFVAVLVLAWHLFSRHDFMANY